MTQPHYIIIERALRRLAKAQGDQPSLADLADEAGLSEFHFQRVFKEWVGISPKKFLQHVTLQAAKECLQDSANVLDTAYEVGLSGPGRLHDLFITLEAMTPGAYKRGGAGVEIRYGIHDSPFGDCLIALTDQGICGLGFADPERHDAALTDFKRRWPAARFIEDEDATAQMMPLIFPDGKTPQAGVRPRLSLAVPGTAFQIKVWQALLTIPPGALVTYNAIAKKLGYEKTAARAVGQAVGANPVSWLIPCHRVIRETGAITGYHWGIPRKLAMIGWEATQQDRQAG